MAVGRFLMWQLAKHHFNLTSVRFKRGVYRQTLNFLASLAEPLHYNLLYSIALYCEPFIFAKKSHVQSISPKNVYICIRVGGKIPAQQGRHSKFLPVNIAKQHGERRTNARLCFGFNRPWCRLDKKQAWDRVSSIRSVKVFGDTYRQTA